MQELTCRQLGPSDRDAFLLALRNRQPLFGNRNSALNLDVPTLKSIESKLLSTSSYWAIFEGQRIIASLAAYPWASLPYYSLSEFSIVQDRPIPFYKAAETLFRHAIEHMERSGRFTFYIATRLRSFQISEMRKHQRLRKIIRSIPAFDRYTVYTENIVPPNQSPEFLAHKLLLNNNVWECPVLIRKGVLKEEFRNEIFQRILDRSSS